MHARADADAERLARDEVEVAIPILERSPVLSEAVLTDIVRTNAMQYALAVAGALGVAHMLQLLVEELHATMAQAGCATLADITPNCLTPSC